MNNWIVCALLSAFFAGLVAIFGKVGMREIDSTVATTARSIIMASALVILTCCRSQFSQIMSIPQKSWVFVFLAGMAGAASWLFYFQALKLGDASKVAPIDRLSVLVTLLLAWLFLGEKVSSGVLGGSILVLVGAILIARG
jgi:bacterial/archaeal transporter family protein